MRPATILPATAFLLAAVISLVPFAAAGGPLTANLEAVNGEVCSAVGNSSTPCESIHGRPLGRGGLDVCAPSAPVNNLIGATLWLGVQTVDGAAKSATGDAPRPVSGGVCRSVYGDAFYVASEAEAYFGLCEPTPANLLRELVRQTACPHLP